MPLDFPSIRDALARYPRAPSASAASLGDDATRYSPAGTVVLLPGRYEEPVRVGGALWAEGRDPRVEIRAAFPSRGATIASRRAGGGGADEDRDRPCISISTVDSDILGGMHAQKAISVRLSYLQVLHSSPGVSL